KAFVHADAFLAGAAAAAAVTGGLSSPVDAVTARMSSRSDVVTGRATRPARALRGRSVYVRPRSGRIRSAERLVGGGDERRLERGAVLVGGELADRRRDVGRPRDLRGGAVGERAHHGVVRPRGDRGLLVRTVVRGVG